MAKQQSTQKPHTSRSAYDDFIHSEEFDSQYDYDRFYDGERKRTQRSTAGVERSASARTKQAKPKRKKEVHARRKGAKRETAPRPTSGEAAPRRLSDEYLQMKAEKEHAKKQKQQKTDHFTTLIAAVVITLIIFVFSLATLTGKVEQYSENENRYLAGTPSFSASSVADGKFMKDVESYLSDQFFGRSFLVKSRTAIDITLGKKEVNGVYIGKDHYLFEKPTAYDENIVGKTIQSINDFTDKHKKIHSYIAIAPDSTALLTDLMPNNAPNEDQQKQIKTVYAKLTKNIKTIDICSTLSKSDDKPSLYYRTDHHWTTKAAELAFKQIAANMKIDTSKIKYETYAVTNDFQGTLASSSGLFNAKDNIYITVPQSDVSYFVTYVNENKKASSVFNAEKLKEKNKYEVFFGGNFAQVKIDTTLNSKKVLMVVKDSYANCLVPMLIPYYKSIVMIDPRYYTDKIEQTVKDEGVTDVLWLYNANTFLADTSVDGTF